MNLLKTMFTKKTLEIAITFVFYVIVAFALVYIFSILSVAFNPIYN